ncbi:hypothetical protein Q5691_26675 [Microcoleus sp. w1-18aA5]|uniref:hypothetical protein n=1 Tax=Microcoleus sp. w1-18aA5 TaxID=2818982 RepID=UPI002FD4BC30
MKDLTPHFKTIAIKYSYSLALAHPYWDLDSCLLKIDMEKLKRDVGFWRAIIRQVKCDLEKAVELMLRESLGRQHFNPFVDNFSWAADIVTAPDFNPDLCKGKVEVSRDPPPKIFIPIPKSESNGCARSDSLICSLIF